MNNAREIKIIDRAMGILNTPSKWIKGATATNKDGVKTYPPSDETTCFCIHGAIYKALYEQKIEKHKWHKTYYKIAYTICKVANIGHTSVPIQAPKTNHLPRKNNF